MLKLFKNLKSYTPFLVVCLITVAITSACDLLLPDYMSNIVKNGIIAEDVSFILKTGGIMLIISGVSMIAAIIGSYCSSMTAMGFGKTVRSKIFGKVEYFSEKEFDKFSTASLITRTTNDVTQVQMVVMIGLRMMVSSPIMFVGGIVMAVRKAPDLSWIMLIILPVILIIAAIVMKITIPSYNILQKRIDKINLLIREKLNGIRVIRAFNKSEYEDNRFSGANKDLTDTSLKVGKIMAFMMPLMMLLMNVTTLLVLWVGAYNIESAAEVGDLMAFMQYLVQVMMSFMMATMMFIMIPRAQVSAKRINEVLETEYSILDKKNAEKFIKKNGAPAIEFKNVSFSYEGSEKKVLSNISFSAKEGEMVAIIGSTGSGKSTLVNLIPRFYDTTDGEIIFYGNDIKDLEQNELRKNMGYIPQKAFLFNGTINDNVREGDESASEADIEKALAISQAEEFVSAMPEKGESFISQGATNVSGGQKQRLSIARALVRKVGLYIFDDTFSALDFKTDSNLRAAIKKELKNSCILVVAQRVGTIMNADKILVLENGELCGTGTHRELLETCPVYKEIVDSQLKEEDAA